ncbi:hypothetical protein RRG08_030090 [Elysia crispata]|uniref:Uncharacterized protein n=1 Tax=Elysia crispata TaxID=231223 RepID=A0AAE0ZR16_9GAST|nr:hypothetical protein RRG08_030090 [Elysia crispata]
MRRSRRLFFRLLGLPSYDYILLWSTVTTWPEQSINSNPHLYRPALLTTEPWPEVEGLQWTPNGLRDDLPPGKDSGFYQATATDSSKVFQTFPVAGGHVVWCGSKRWVLNNKNITIGDDHKDCGIF